ncbi:MAG TPA: hypothetical protein VFU47_12775 [Armatimonadota bacterium]|nr:hypothetical protein [Armatimonadota bacterium]
MDRTDVERILAENVSPPVSAEEVEELLRHVAWHERLSAILRALPLDREEAAFPPEPQP